MTIPSARVSSYDKWASHAISLVSATVLWKTSMGDQLVSFFQYHNVWGAPVVGFICISLSIFVTLLLTRLGLSPMRNPIFVPWANFTRFWFISATILISIGAYYQFVNKQVVTANMWAAGAYACMGIGILWQMVVRNDRSFDRVRGINYGHGPSDLVYENPVR